MTCRKPAATPEQRKNHFFRGWYHAQPCLVVSGKSWLAIEDVCRLPCLVLLMSVSESWDLSYMAGDVVQGPQHLQLRERIVFSLQHRMEQCNENKAKSR